VEIGADGWRAIGVPPVRFRRSAGMLPLPVPEPGGSIEALVPLLNLASRNDFVLVVMWLWAHIREFHVRSGPRSKRSIPGYDADIEENCGRVAPADISV
jgi:hypothetical protein